MIAPDTIPELPRGVRMHHDRVRGIWVLLAPERVMPLDDVGRAILTELDGARSFEAVVAALAAKFDAPADRIAEDASEFLGGLQARRFVELRA